MKIICLPNPLFALAVTKIYRWLTGLVPALCVSARCPTAADIWLIEFVYLTHLA
jgi:hypothetical protein